MNVPINQKTTPLWLLVSLFLLSSCARTNFTQTGTIFPVYKGVVKVFLEQPRDVEYEEIGLVSAKGWDHNDAVDLIKHLQKRAARNGANAIILLYSNQTPKFETDGEQAKIKIDKEALALAIRMNPKQEFIDKKVRE